MVGKRAGRVCRLAAFARRGRGRCDFIREVVARPDNPSRCTLPMTALRVTPPRRPAIWLALNPSDQSFLRSSTLSSVQAMLVAPLRITSQSRSTRRGRGKRPTGRNGARKRAKRRAMSGTHADAIGLRTLLGSTLDKLTRNKRGATQPPNACGSRTLWRRQLSDISCPDLFTVQHPDFALQALRFGLDTR